MWFLDLLKDNYDDGKDVPHESDDKPVEPQEHVHVFHQTTVTEVNHFCVSVLPFAGGKKREEEETMGT